MPGDLTAQIDDFLGTLREEVAKVEYERNRLRAEYLLEDDRLKASVAKAKRLIRANESKQGQKPKSKTKTSPTHGVDAEKLEALADWLRTNMNGHEFAGPQLWDEYDFGKDVGIHSMPQFSKALTALHERGTLRLVRTGGIEGLGNRTKVWKVTK